MTKGQAEAGVRGTLFASSDAGKTKALDGRREAGDGRDHDQRRVLSKKSVCERRGRRERGVPGDPCP